MRAVIIRCPNCNANLEIASTVSSVTCSYCGVVSRIQAKTAMFQVPASLPPTQTPQQRAEQLQNLAQLSPIRRFSPMLMVIPMIAIAVIGAGISFAVRSSVGRMNNKLLWGGAPPVLIDVDRDGVSDLIGVVRYVVDGDRAHLAAYSGLNGARLWESEALGTYSSLGQWKLARFGGLFLMSSDRGTLVARDAANGRVKWNVSFSEKIDVVCAGGPDAVVVGTADDKWSVVDAQGARSPGPKLVRLDREYTNDEARGLFDEADPKRVCIPIAGPWRATAGVLTLKSWHDLAKVDGMNIEFLARRFGGKDTIGIGAKRPGTAVPMIAKIEGASATWVAEIPGSDPLVARFADEGLALGETKAFALYETSNPSGARMTAFDIASGKRLWDRPIPTPTGFVASGMVVNGDVVLLSTWGDLRAYSAIDGTDRFTVGTSN